MNGLYAKEIAGEGGPALVLLHGFAGSHRVWREVAAGIGPASQIIAYDLPGHGGSLAISPAGGARAAAAAVISDLEARGIPRFHLAGHSFGGAAAALMALLVPERVATLTLLAPGGFGPEINAPLLRDYASASTREEIELCLRAMTGGGGPFPKVLIEDALAFRSAPGQREALLQLVANITRDGRQGVLPREALGALSMPVRIVWGGRDPVLPVTQLENAPANFIPHVFAGLGHMLPIEAPEQIASLLRLSTT